MTFRVYTIFSSFNKTIKPRKSYENKNKSIQVENTCRYSASRLALCLQYLLACSIKRKRALYPVDSSDVRPCCDVCSCHRQVRFIQVNRFETERLCTDEWSWVKR